MVPPVLSSPITAVEIRATHPESSGDVASVTLGGDVFVPKHERPDRILREREVRQLTGLSRTTRWELVRRDQFPKPVPLIAGGNKGRW
jgi:predicted DNA-binding transcriptional regulator AlpA